MFLEERHLVGCRRRNGRIPRCPPSSLHWSWHRQRSPDWSLSVSLRGDWAVSSCLLPTHRWWIQTRLVELIQICYPKSTSSLRSASFHTCPVVAVPWSRYLATADKLFCPPQLARKLWCPLLQVCQNCDSGSMVPFQRTNLPHAQCCHQSASLPWCNMHSNFILQLSLQDCSEYLACVDWRA